MAIDHGKVLIINTVEAGLKLVLGEILQNFHTVAQEVHNHPVK